MRIYQVGLRVILYSRELEILDKILLLWPIAFLFLAVSLLLNVIETGDEGISYVKKDG